ncbi:TlpA family protein disulfide reductase [Micromonospora okii]|uniref:TlpA family protein disulfide reductase n=1 Tax=Micromonospora okii TaxID=1182970 RepID=UPI001E615615|nr:hypothetical protein [Micromonospora okii]
MSTLVAAVIVLAVFSVFQLVLVTGLMRRVAELSARVADLAVAAPVQLDRMVAVGTPPGEFHTVTEADGPISNRTLPEPTLVGFFTPGCKPCRSELPHFVARAAVTPGGRDHVLAVIGDLPGADEYRDQLVAVARVVVEEPRGPVTTAFEVKGTPAFAYLGPGGAVAASAITVDGLPAPVPA